jgi:hypothetical protein
VAFNFVDILKLQNLIPFFMLKRIGHDNSGSNPGWLLKDVQIETSDRQFFYFPCNKWLDLNEDDGKIERSLKPERIVQDSVSKNYVENTMSTSSSRSSFSGREKSRSPSSDSILK